MYFDYDVFISYPHLDNREGRGGDGWVERFNEDLDRRLTVLLGRRARIWRDNQMPFGAAIDGSVRGRLRKTRVLLCVVSPAYLRSKWCLEEVREFRAAAEHNGGLVLGDQSRIIPVIKTPTGPLPEGLDRWLRCEFYESDEDRGGAPAEFSQTEGGRGYDAYRDGVNAVAWAVTLVVKQLGDEEPPTEERPTVYLAESTFDRDDDSLQIRRELESRGFVVLPDPDTPLRWRTADQYAEAVRDCLRRSFMSIHLMGRSYGNIPDGGRGRSLPHIQNELAAEHSADDKRFVRVIWIPREMEEAETEQAGFLEELRESEAALAGAELLERSLQEMKTRLFQILKKREEEEEEEPPASSGGRLSIYLMCDQADDELVKPVGGFLYGKGFNVFAPAENQKSRIRHHRKCLVRCDATLTIYGKAEYDWVLDRYDDVVSKARGYGRKSDIKCQAILPTDPETRRKGTIFLQSVKVLPPCYNGLSDNALKVSLAEFIAALDSGPAPVEGGHNEP